MHTDPAAIDVLRPCTVWAALDAATRGRTAFTLGTLGTVDAAGRPRARAIILRAVDAATVSFATDARSAKVAELTRTPSVAFAFWDPERGVQLRLEGRAEVVADGRLRRDAWERLSPGGRAQYAGVSPGRPFEEEGGHRQAIDGEARDATAFPNFSWVTVAVERIDALDLAGDPHIRCLHVRRGDDWASARLTP